LGELHPAKKTKKQTGIKNLMDGKVIQIITPKQNIPMFYS